MFSGIVECFQPVREVKDLGGSFLIKVERPTDFDDIKEGDSIALNGVCLTVQSFDQNNIHFVIGVETLKVTGWTIEKLSTQKFNLERSLKVSDRLHGHWVLGHVDVVTSVIAANEVSGCLILRIALRKEMAPYIWPKGSVALNGVSLTINDVGADFFEVCLIPETLKRTNLKNLKAGDQINMEWDSMARAFVRWFQLHGSQIKSNNEATV